MPDVEPKESQHMGVADMLHIQNLPRHMLVNVVQFVYR